MKRLTILQKVLLSLAPVANIVIMLWVIFPVYTNTSTLNYRIITISGTLFWVINAVLLYRRVNKFTKISKRERDMWNGLVTVYHVFGALPYIWKKDDEFCGIEGLN